MQRRGIGRTQVQVADVDRLGAEAQALACIALEPVVLVMVAAALGVSGTRLCVSPPALAFPNRIEIGEARLDERLPVDRLDSCARRVGARAEWRETGYGSVVVEERPEVCAGYGA